MSRFTIITAVTIKGVISIYVYHLIMFIFAHLLEKLIITLTPFGKYGSGYHPATRPQKQQTLISMQELVVFMARMVSVKRHDMAILMNVVKMMPSR